MSRIRELALYCVIAILVAAAAILIGVYRGTHRLPPAPVGWTGFGIFTLLVFWWALRANRPFFAQSRLWVAVAIFAAAHLAVGYVILSRFSRGLSLVDFALAAPIEYYALIEYLRFVIRPKSQRP
ncbi:MAG TPA: hypothetical protein VG206_17590 [Terriglobia bacterium]|nr:hypothetical protein [Terriglobia bacterium]